ncbi:unnamed protein product, partial [Staurois parvus]
MKIPNFGLFPEQEERGNLSMGTVLVARGSPKNSLNFQGFPLTSYIGYGTESEEKSPKCD